MTVEGYCISCRGDVPVNDTRCCLTDGMVTIPPTYGKRTQTWVDGTWEPFIPKPDGYVWKDPGVRDQERQAARTETVSRSVIPVSKPAPKRAPKPALSPNVTFVCAQCRVKVTKPRQGGKPLRFCGRECHQKWHNEKRRQAKREQQV